MGEKKKVLVVYYSQTGQMLRILESVTSPLRKAGVELDFCPIVPEPDFPFPWPSDQFFDAFPESFIGIPCRIRPLDVNPATEYDLIVVGYSPWYLSPSIPIHSFLQSDQAKALLKGKKVVTIIGCRNMWIQSQEKMKRYFKSLEAELVGNMALRDKAGNLTSVLTIIRWVIKGQKEKSRFLPASGVSDADIASAATFGELINEAMASERYDDLQNKLIVHGAVLVKPNLVLFERNGSKIFKMFSRKILKKGPYGDPRRKNARRLFKYYLLFVLFVVSPVGSGVYFFIKPFILKKIRQDRAYFSQNALID